MSIFTDTSVALAELSDLRVRMIAASPGLSSCALAVDAGGSSYLQRKLAAAEAEAQRHLQVFLEPTEIFPVVGPTPDQITALGGKPYAIEPAYDMPEQFVGNTSTGFIQLLQRPVSSVTSVTVVGPTNTTVYDIPPAWFRLDGRHGQLSIMPSGLASSMPVSLFQLQALAWGTMMPHMIWIRYSAGLARDDYHVPDIQDLILRLACVRVLEDQFQPDSSSISADGLSRSISRDISKQRDAVLAQLEDLRESINGLQFGVF